MQQWDGVERRVDRSDRSDRRGAPDRRGSVERRFDFRNAEPESRRSLKAWFRSLANARLGVDRRKGVDRRTLENRRSEALRSLLTPEELADLLRE